MMQRTPSSSLRRRTWEIVEAARPGDVASRRFDLFIVALVALNVAAVMLESVRSIGARHGAAFLRFETVSVAVFCAEYLARLWSCVDDPRFAGRWGRLRFALHPLSMVDLLAFAPFMVTLGSVDLRVLRATRLLRVLRLLKAARYVDAVRHIRRVLHARRDELILTTGVMVVLLLIASSVIYFAENEAQPEQFSSIPQSMWWAVATLTTVGYGDVVPVTVMGRVAAGFVSVLGVGFFALPTAILGAGFVEEVRGERATATCPRCGAPLDPTDRAAARGSGTNEHGDVS